MPLAIVPNSMKNTNTAPLKRAAEDYYRKVMNYTVLITPRNETNKAFKIFNNELNKYENKYPHITKWDTREYINKIGNLVAAKFHQIRHLLPKVIKERTAAKKIQRFYIKRLYTPLPGGGLPNYVLKSAKSTRSNLKK
jgi:hypothetical protein